VIDCICFQDAMSVIHSGKNALLDPSFWLVPNRQIQAQ
jgi:hypothetical protein